MATRAAVGHEGEAADFQPPQRGKNGPDLRQGVENFEKDGV